MVRVCKPQHSGGLRVWHQPGLEPVSQNQKQNKTKQDKIKLNWPMWLWGRLGTVTRENMKDFSKNIFVTHG